MKKGKQKTPKTVEKHETERKKNKAEIFVVCLCWILVAFMVGVACLSIVINFFSFQCMLYEIFHYCKKMTCLLLLLCMIILAILCIIAKKRKTPHIRFKYYLRLLILFLAFFIELRIESCVAEHHFYTIPINNPYSSTYAKPIIYLYPTEQTKVEVMVGKPHNLTHTYPKYQNGWRVVAEPNGDLTDLAGRHYYALYWEGKHFHKPTPKDGFIVKSADTISFLEEKLARLGLSEREANEFIVYWLPKLESNEYNFIRFKTQAEIDDNMPLYIMPAPDTMIRVLMEYRKADQSEKPVIQELPPTPERTGFVAVEWGGTEI